MENLLCTKHCAPSWGDRHESDGSLSPPGVHSLSEGRHDKRRNEYFAGLVRPCMRWGRRERH